MGPGSSLENVAVQRIEGAATLLDGLRLRQRRRGAEHFAETRTGRSARLRLLRDVTDLRLHLLGVLVAVLELVGDLRRNSAFGRVGLDIGDHLQFGLAEISDQLASLVRRRLAVARGLDHLAAALGFLAQGNEALHAAVRPTAGVWRRSTESAGNRGGTL